MEGFGRIWGGCPSGRAGLSFALGAFAAALKVDSYLSIDDVFVIIFKGFGFQATSQIEYVSNIFYKRRFCQK